MGHSYPEVPTKLLNYLPKACPHGNSIILDSEVSKENLVGYQRAELPTGPTKLPISRNTYLSEACPYESSIIITL